MNNKEIKELGTFLSVRQTADELGYSKEGIRKLIKSGELSPVSKVDDFYLIHREAIDTFKKSRKSLKLSDKRFKEI